MYTWDQFSTDNIRKQIKSFAFALKPSPHSGHLLVDALWIVLLAALQCSIIPSIFGSIFHVDLLMSWLTVAFIRQEFWRSLILLSLAAYLLETHATLPVGIYFCIYGVTLAVISNLKSPFSWSHRAPWFACIFVTNIWATAFEVIVMAIISEPHFSFDWGTIFWVVLRLFVGISFGLLLIVHEMREGIG